MREIKPEDVYAMLKSGELYPHIILEFGRDEKFHDSKNLEFIGCITDCACKKWLAYDRDMDIIVAFDYARFPLPALRDGDPVVVFDGPDEHHRIFSHFDDYGINCWLSGLNHWTVSGTSVWGEKWRLPTKQELSEAGYTEDQINEMMTRWGVKNSEHKP